MQTPGKTDPTHSESPISEWNPQANAIFLEAIEIADLHLRMRFLDASCADPLLRKEVETLLRAHEEAGQFIAEPAVGDWHERLEPREGVGTTVGPYRLLEVIGEGGFGIVYLAEQKLPLRRQVAVKIIKPGMDTKEVLGRFKAELAVLALMDHPNIARALDAGATDAGRPFFVMELVRGIPITTYCDHHNLSVSERLKLFVQVCGAVQHAHQKGIIHRDLKPSNVLVTIHEGRPMPKVIDFGVAKAIDRRLTQETLFTQFTEMIGTPLYMSPEQAEMTGLDIDTRADIYSLGVVLYELLTGTTPFDPARLKQAAFDEIRRIIRLEEPPRPSLRISSLSTNQVDIATHRDCDVTRLKQLVRGDLDWIVMKALEKDRARRYATANSLAIDVERHLADEPVLACPPSAAYQFQKFVRRHLGPVLAASAVLLALVIGIVGATWGMLRANQAEGLAIEAAHKTQLALDDKQAALTQKVAALGAAEKSERSQSEQLWQSLVAQARARRLSHRPGQRFESLEILQQAIQLARSLKLSPAKFHELRNAAIATLAVPDLDLSGPWISWPPDGVALDFDVAQTVCACTDRAGHCTLRRVTDGSEICRVPGSGTVRLRQDGKFVASAVRKDAIEVWQVDKRTPRRVLSASPSNEVHFYNPDRVALGYADGSIRLFELASGREIGRLAPAGTLNRQPIFALHPTRPLVAVGSYFVDELQLRDLQTGKVLASSPVTDSTTRLAWHPDGRTLLAAMENGQVCFYDRDTWRIGRTLDVRIATTSISFDRTGNRMAVCGWYELAALFDYRTGERLMSASPSCTHVAVRFSPDGTRLAGAVQDGKVGIWSVAGSQEFRTLVRNQAPPPKDDRYGRAAIAPDGRLLACVRAEGIGLWDMVTGSAVALIPHPEVRTVLFEPSGSLLTLGEGGALRWPIGSGSEIPGTPKIGPPEALPLPDGLHIALSRDGHTLVTASRTVSTQEPHAGAWLLHTDRPGRAVHLDPGADIREVAVSPDGQWLVTATHDPGLAKIWDARHGRLIKKLADWGFHQPCFSPDGRWLSSSLDNGRLFAVGSWQPLSQLGGAAVFSPDGKIAAVPTPAGLRLFEPESAREIAVLEDPDLDVVDQALFTPDGTKLISVNALHGIHIWDLRLIRSELKVLGLDWDWPDFSPAPAEQKATASRSVRNSLRTPKTAP